MLVLAAIALPTELGAQDLAITNVRLYPSPNTAPIDRATIIVRDSTIVAVGRGQATDNLDVLDGGGRAATAGLWNSHVHFMDPELRTNAAAIVRDMLLRYGFTAVVDTGSVPEDTRRLVAAIERGELDGPRVVTASGGFVFTDGTPAYLPGIRLPELAAPAAAKPAVDALLDAGEDGIKIFAGSFITPTETILLPPDIIRAVTLAAHARGSFVFAHPTNRESLVNAVDNGVDVLAHTAPSGGALGAELIAKMLEREIALIPTLKLWSWELRRANVPEPALREFQNAGVAQTAEYLDAGGEILFGTDVGYMRDYDTAEEFEMLRRAGMSFDTVLTTLTTAPARRFARLSGVVEPGAPGDIVIFADDPAADVTAFARVAFTIRGGRVVFEATPDGVQAAADRPAPEPPAVLNHFYAVVDADTAAAIAASPFLEKFAASDVLTTTANDGETWTGRYLRGRETYVELFGPGDFLRGDGAPAPAGAIGVAIGGDVAGLTDQLQGGLQARGSSFTRSLETRRIQDRAVDWFDAITPYADAEEEPDFFIWAMEYRAAYFEAARPNGRPYPGESGDISRLRYQSPFYDDALPMRDVVGAELAVTRDDFEKAKPLLDAGGFAVAMSQDSAVAESGGVRLRFRFVAPDRIGLRTIDFALRQAAPEVRIERIGASVLTVGPGSSATWTFDER
jgi:imidazolonepropionase-like amidohydrolase